MKRRFRSWRLIPHFLLRRAGFPFGHLQALAAPRSAALAGEVVEAESRAEQARGALLREHFPAAVKSAAAAKSKAQLKALSRWRQRVGRRESTPVPEGSWPAALLRVHAAFEDGLKAAQQSQARLEATLAEENAHVRVSLRSFFQRPDARHALFLLSPDLLESMEHALDRPASPHPDAGERALERRLYAFAQRLAAKNETTSFFGPLLHCEVAGDEGGFRFGPESQTGVTKRRAFFAFWAAAALGKAAAADPAIRRQLAVRRVAAASVTGTLGRGPDGRAVTLTPEAAALFSMVDDRAPLGRLAERLEWSLEKTEAHLRPLERAGLLRRDLEPLSTTAFPLADVSLQLPNLPEAEQWRAVVREFEGYLEDFAAADLAGRRAVLKQAEAAFTRVTGQPARRAAGKTYADRTILYEDCLGDLAPVTMSVAEASRLEDAITPLLQLGAHYGRLRHEAIRELARRTLSTLEPPVPFLMFADALEALIVQGELEPLWAPAQGFLELLSQKVRAASDGHVARLGHAELAELLDEVPSGRFASPDVMLQAPGVHPRYVIGEVHPYVFAWGSQNQFAPDPERLQAAFRNDLTPWGGPERLATVLRRRRHKGLVSNAFPGAFIEVTGRSVMAPERRLAIADLLVVNGEAGPELHGPRGPLTLYTGEDDHPHLRAFAAPQVEMPPVRFPHHTPRIELGDFVLQRERWSFSEGALPELVSAKADVALALEVARLARRLGLPRFLFAHSPAETKPVCLDLEGPLARSHLRRLLSLGRLTLTEMLPAPRDLWLTRQAGPHTSELRLAMVLSE